MHKAAAKTPYIPPLSPTDGRLVPPNSTPETTIEKTKSRTIERM